MDYQLCDIIAIWLVSIMFVINMRNSELKYKKNTILESSSLASKTEIIFLNISDRLVKKRALYAEWSIWGTIFQFLAQYASSSCLLALTLSRLLVSKLLRAFVGNYFIAFSHFNNIKKK